MASRSWIRLVRLSSLSFPPWRLTVVYVRTISPRPALSMYGTPSRFSSNFFLSCWMSELILSLRSSSPSPSVIFPLRSRIVTPLTTLSSICITLSSNPTVSNR